MKELEMRYSEPSDKKYLIEWLKDEKLNKWYPPTGEKEIELFVANWIGFTKYNAGLTVTADGKVCALGSLFLMSYLKVAHQALLYQIVDPALSDRNEICDSLLKNMLNLAKNYFHLELAVIELFEGDSLIKIVEKYGFKEFALQKRYVKKEDGYSDKILFQLFL